MWIQLDCQTESCFAGTCPSPHAPFLLLLHLPHTLNLRHKQTTKCWFPNLPFPPFSDAKKCQKNVEIKGQDGPSLFLPQAIFFSFVVFLTFAIF